MTEPVGYLVHHVNGDTDISTHKKIGHGVYSTPLYTAEQLHPRVKMTQAEFDLLSGHNRGLRAFEQLEECIEVESNMKWFVRRILPNAGGNMLYYTDEGVLTYNNNKEHATKFDTKEEAELWTNPLTEAVQLPVEDE
ncbi:hypothetical protein [Leuconostoc pseudomesenteroides]|uniref:hypothetical protein n=1 Tax=Leuconostoc pseudomesenteroides TaxID=33968 RepID=UPI0021A44C76|nr:hypothetical protein [Leuconostoc pseudomesenteroides]MCT4412845.1 hypothetical protein [Leuconostoc pseudomesenteroides]